MRYRRDEGGKGWGEVMWRRRYDMFLEQRARGALSANYDGLPVGAFDRCRNLDSCDSAAASKRVKHLPEGEEQQSERSQKLHH